MTTPAFWTLLGFLAVSAAVEDPPAPNPDYDEAIRYYKLDASERTRTKALELLEKALPTVTDDRLRREIYLDEARLYSQSYDHATEKADMPLAIDRYILAITVKGFRWSLDGLRARDELGAILLVEKRTSEAYVLFTEVVDSDFEKVCKDEIKPSFLAQLTEIDHLEKARGLQDHTPEYDAMVKRRIGIARGNVLYYYKSIRESSLRELIKIVQLDNGEAGLKQLEEKYRQDKDANAVIQRALQPAAPETH